MLRKRSEKNNKCALDQIIEALSAGDLSAVRYVCGALASCPADMAEKILPVLSRVFASAGASEICALDSNLRSWVCWRKGDVKRIIGKCANLDEQRSVLFAATFAGSGYVRQYAVEQLAYFPGAISYIALRCNDWVQAVRQSAYSSLAAAVSRAPDDELTEALPMFEKLRRSKRGDYPAIKELLLREVGRRPGYIQKVLESADIIIRKYCLSSLADPTEDRDVIIRHISHERDPFLRYLCFEALKDNMPEGVMEMFLNDRFPGNRIKALQHLYKRNQHQALGRAKEALLSPNSGVRSVAQFIVRKCEPDTDLRAFYLRVLNNAASKSLQGCIGGLGENGAPEDSRTLEAYLGHSSASIAASAMSAVMNLDHKRYSARIAEMLVSESPAVSKTAYRLLLKYKCTDFEQIFEMYRASADENTRCRCASLLFSESKWQQLMYALILLDDSSEKVRSASVRQIDSWMLKFNNSYAVLSDEQRNIIIDLINQSTHLDDKIRSELKFLARK